MNELVAYWFPPVQRKYTMEYTDFNFWRQPLPSFDLPDLSPPSPALSARSTGSSRFGLIRFGASNQGVSNEEAKNRRETRSGSAPPDLSASPSSSVPSDRPTSPLGQASFTSEGMHSDDDFDTLSDSGYFGSSNFRASQPHGRRKSSTLGGLPDSVQEALLVDRRDYLATDWDKAPDLATREPHGHVDLLQEATQDLDLDDDILAAQEMDRIPYL